MEVFEAVGVAGELGHVSRHSQYSEDQQQTSQHGFPDDPEKSSLVSSRAVREGRLERETGDSEYRQPF